MSVSKSSGFDSHGEGPDDGLYQGRGRFSKNRSDGRNGRNTRQNVKRGMIRKAVSARFSDKIHQKIREYENDNVGVEAAEKTSSGVEHTARVADNLHQARKIRQARQKAREYQNDKKDWSDDDIPGSGQDTYDSGSKSESAQTGSVENYSSGSIENTSTGGFQTEEHPIATKHDSFSGNADSVQESAIPGGDAQRESRREFAGGKGRSPNRAEVLEGDGVAESGLAAKNVAMDGLTDNSVTFSGIYSGGKSGFYSADSAESGGIADGGTKAGTGSYGAEGYKSLLHESSGGRQFSGAEEEVLKSPFYSNPESKIYQKKQIKRQYASALREKNLAAMTEQTSSKAANGIIGKAKEGLSGAVEMLTGFVEENSHLLIMLGIAGLVVAIVAATVSSCTVVFQGTSEAVMGSSFTATTENIRKAEDYYRGLEADLRQELADLEEENPGYDEYRIERGEIGHNPFELAAFLTVLYEDYNLRKVKNTLDALFAAQYSLTQHASIETVTETRTVRVGESLGTVVTSGYCNCRICCGGYAGGPTASGVMPTQEHTIAVDSRNPYLPLGTKVVMNGTEYTVEDTGPLERYGVIFDIYYDDHDIAEAHGHQNWEVFLADDNGANEVTVTQTSTKNILTVSVNAHSLREVIDNYDLTEVQRARFELLLQTKGNRKDLFPDDIYSNFSPGAYTDYDIPPEALSDVRFANMIREGEKYLGYPYVWGGDSPETSFDCSGFVSWVINHCGNGWSYGRLTAEELRQVCAIIPPGEAKPGDLIFFQGTYDTAGASHVGIYVGNNTMMHCGHPVQYASIDTDYWRSHFYCFGRLP